MRCSICNTMLTEVQTSSSCRCRYLCTGRRTRKPRPWGLHMRQVRSATLWKLAHSWKLAVGWSSSLSCFFQSLCKQHVDLVWLAGIAIGFWTKEQILEEGLASEDLTVFEPQISQEKADARFAKWNRAVELSYGLADFAAG